MTLAHAHRFACTLLCMAASAAYAQREWTFDLSETSVHEAWVGEEVVYLLAPYANRNEDDNIAPTPGLPLLTYRNKEGYPADAAIAAIDLKDGKLRWARGYAGDYIFALDSKGKDLWAMSATFDRLAAANGKTIESVPFAPKTAEHANVEKSFRAIHGIRVDGEVSWGGSRFGRGVQDPLAIYDFDTKEVLQLTVVNAKTPNKLQQADLAYDQSPELQQTHVQLRPIGGGNATWRFSTGGYSTNRPVMFASDVLAMTGMPSTTGLVVRLDGATGAPRWVTRLPRGAYSVNQAQLKDGWYGQEHWSAVGKLDEHHIFAIGGDGMINLLDAESGQIISRFKTDDVYLAPPRFVEGAVVVVGESRIVSVPLDVALGKTPHEGALQKQNAAKQFFARRGPPNGVNAADEATELWPVSVDAWRTLMDLHIASKQPDGAVRAGCRLLELTGTGTTPYLKQEFGLLSRIDTGALRVPVLDLGLFIYAPSTDGILYVIDPDTLQVVEKTIMQGDAGGVYLQGNQLIRRGDDRRSEVLLTLPNMPERPLRGEPFFEAMEERQLRANRKEQQVPREWNTEGGPYGPKVEIDGRRVRTVAGGGVQELSNNQIVDHAPILDGVDRWHLVRTVKGPLGFGAGGLFKLDSNFRPAEFIVDLRNEGSDFGMPAVLTADTDGSTLALIHDDPRKHPRVLTLSIRSADGKRVIRNEMVLPPNGFDDLSRESARLFKLGEGYFYAGGELAWIPADPTKQVWRFRANDAPDRPRSNMRNDTIDRSFGIPRIRDGKLFAGCRYGGVYVFDINTITKGR